MANVPIPKKTWISDIYKSICYTLECQSSQSDPKLATFPSRILTLKNGVYRLANNIENTFHISRLNGYWHLSKIFEFYEKIGICLLELLAGSIIHSLAILKKDVNLLMCSLLMDTVDPMDSNGHKYTASDIHWREYCVASFTLASITYFPLN